MTTTADRNRVRTGVPAGGQFAVESRAESDVSLAGPAAPARDWGSVSNVQEGSRTPWGPVQHLVHVADGIVEVGTGSHGGMKLSPQRNQQVPTALRTSSGWYEEDCEAQIVLMTFPDEYAASRARERRGNNDPWTDPAFVAERARASVKNWSPDGYEKATGETVAPGESTVKDERLFLDAHATDQVAVSATYSEAHPGMVEVTTTTGGGRDPGSWENQRVFLVPKDEYAADRTRFVADPDRHTDITPPPVVKVPVARIHPVIDTSGLTPTAKERFTMDLAQRWRRDDGSVATLRDVLATEGVTGKSADTFDNSDKVTYYLQQTRNVGDSGGPILTTSSWRSPCGGSSCPPAPRASSTRS
ncbi:DUF7007 domain-containing protein [Oerskovia enterophila]|uniref:DUF7007 domain-containing protein n=1 Tax=Oerskovia enterophila TaxID=43678 RepID=A0ABX2Y9D1_9CELL|nr:hypothetical protein OERS_04650 [Oerskovia enterophila]